MVFSFMFLQVLLLVVNVLRTMYIPGHVGHWTETVVILPVSVSRIKTFFESTLMSQYSVLSVTPMTV